MDVNDIWSQIFFVIRPAQLVPDYKISALYLNF